jgi:hypothetical protein
MRRPVSPSLVALGLLAATAAAPAVARAQFAGYGLVTGAGGAQQLVRFNTAAPSGFTVLGTTGQTLTGIDFRPATGELYGFNGSGVYTVNLSTGTASLVGTGIGQTVGGNVAFDFNPTVDRIRLVGPDGTNLRLNPVTGGVAAVDGPYTYASGTPSFTAAAYTNSVAGNFGGTTQLFAIDRNLGTLVLLGAPNGGAATTVGSLGLGATPGVTGFDIVTVGGVNTGFFTTAGNAGSSLYRIDLSTGASTLVGSFGAGVNVQGLAISAVPEPGTWALLATGLLGVAGVARRRRSA